MYHSYYKTAGRCLIAGSVLLILTMVLHPSGGSLAHIAKSSAVIIISHALAIGSLPLLVFGFWGLSSALSNRWRLSMLALAIVLFGLVAAMIAAAINGLALPLFAKNILQLPLEHTAMAKTIVIYGNALNRSMDYVFITAMLLAVGIWSSLMLSGKYFPRWIGVLGLLLTALGIAGLCAAFNYTSLTRFRLFILITTAWIIVTGVLLTRAKKTSRM